MSRNAFLIYVLAAAALLAPSLARPSGAATDFRVAMSGRLGGCPLPSYIPASVISDDAFQSQFWRFSTHTYPYCSVPAGTFGQALQKLKGLPAAKQGSPGRIHTGVVTEPTLPDGTGESAWSSAGPMGIDQYWGTVSGHVAAMAVDPANPSVIYIGADTGGIWKTTDGGASWTPLTDKVGTPTIDALAIDPNDHNTIYAGTWNGGYSLYGDAMLKSTDGGATWQQVAPSTFTDGTSFSNITLDPGRPGRVWAVSYQGLYRSDDGGASWTLLTASSGLPVHGLYQVVLDPTNDQTVYATVGQSFGADPAAGIYKSTDGGVSWSLLGTGPNGNTSTSGGNSLVGRIELAVANAATGPILYARVENQSNTDLYGFFRSTDGGASWQTMTTPDPGRGAYWWYDGLLADPNDSTGKTVWAGGMDVWRTTDGGKTWQDVSSGSSPATGGIHVDQHALAAAGSTIYAANDGGIYSTTNAGASWTSLNATLDITQFYSTAADPTPNPVILGGSQDNGIEKSGGTNLRWNMLVGGDGLGTQIASTAPQTYYGGYIFDRVLKSTDGGRDWADITYTPSPYDSSCCQSGIPRDDLNNSCWYSPFPLDPHNAQRILTGTREVWESTNGGSTWSRRSPDLTSANGCVESIAIAPSASETVYAGTTNGKVWMTFNDGSSWRNITAGLPSGSPTSIAVDPSNAMIAYVTIGGCFHGGCVWRTGNGGTTWQDITSNLPDYMTDAIVVDPLDSAHLYIGTDLGVLESTNTGKTWTRLDSAMPIAPVNGLTLNHSGTILSAATYGRGAYELYRSWERLSVAAAYPNAHFYVQGFGFKPYEKVTVGLGGTVRATLTANAAGSTYAYLVVPALSPGQYQVQLTGVSSGRAASKPLTIR